MAISETVHGAFARRADHCDRHGSPFAARLLRALAQAMANGEPMADALPPRLFEPGASAALNRHRGRIDDFRSHPRLLLSLRPGPRDLHLADAQAHVSEIFWHGAAADDLLRTAPRHGQAATSLTIHRFGEPR